MALLKLIYARRMVPIAALADQAGRGNDGVLPSRAGRGSDSAATSPGGARAVAAETGTARAAPPPARPAPRSLEQLQSQLAARKAAAAPLTAPPAPAQAPPAATPARAARAPVPGPVVAAFLERVRVEKKLLHGTFLSKAQRIEPDEGAVVFTFAPEDRAARAAVERARGELEAIAAQVSGGPVAIRTAEGTSTQPAPPAVEDEARARLRRQALEHPAVQATLEVFPAEIREVEEISEP